MCSVSFKMLYTTLLVLAGSLLVTTAPIMRKRSSNDLLVLQFADILEQFETGFYTQALLTFQDSDFTQAGFSSSDIPLEQLVTIQNDEQTHSKALQAAIVDFGGTPITSCQFNFGPVLQSVGSMINVARIIEDVGVGAYLGAAHLISDPVLLTTAGSILTVEARHQTVLNILSGTGTAIPSAFDIALRPEEVLAIVSPFFSNSCNLGVQPNPTLIITNQGPVQPGTLLTFQSSAMTGAQNSLYCQMMIGGLPFSLSLPMSQCIVPGGVNGPVAVFITNDTQPIANDAVNRTPNSLVAGPTILYVDTSPQTLGQFVVNGGNQGSNGTGQTDTFTRVVDPAVASGIMSGALGAPTPTASSFPTNVANAAASVPPSGTTPTGSTPAPTPTGTGTFQGTLGGQNNFIGRADSGVTVNGWKMIPMPPAVDAATVAPTGTTTTSPPSALAPPTATPSFVGTLGGQNNFIGSTGSGVTVNGWARVPVPQS
jgi:hypothetical protein